MNNKNPSFRTENAKMNKYYNKFHGFKLKHNELIIEFLQREWFLILSIVGYFFTSLYLKHFSMPSEQEAEVILVLYAVFVVIEGLRLSNTISKISTYIERGKFIPVKLILGTFILSMFVTNDIALILIVPFTLALNHKNADLLIIFEALAANAGSALTPFGNPQNLYIYWFYNLKPAEFVLTILPFSLTFLLILTALSFFICLRNNEPKCDLPNKNETRYEVKAVSYVYTGMFIAVILVVLHVVPSFIAIIIIALCSLIDTKTLRVDYSLLISLLFLCATTDNMKIILGARIQHHGHVFVISALTSQFLSNVPAAMLLAKFTTNWKALLWGTNTGGFGNMVGSLANLIVYRFYITQNNEKANIPLFTAKFLAIGYLAFFIAMGLFFTFQNSSI